MKSPIINFDVSNYLAFKATNEELWFYLDMIWYTLEHKESRTNWKKFLVKKGYLKEKLQTKPDCETCVFLEATKMSLACMVSDDKWDTVFKYFMAYSMFPNFYSKTPTTTCPCYKERSQCQHTK